MKAKVNDDLRIKNEILSDDRSCFLGLAQYLLCPDPVVAEHESLVGMFDSEEEMDRYRDLHEKKKSFSSERRSFEEYLACRKSKILR